MRNNILIALFKVNDMNYTASVINCDDWLFVIVGPSVIYPTIQLTQAALSFYIKGYLEVLVKVLLVLYI